MFQAKILLMLVYLLNWFERDFAIFFLSWIILLMQFRDAAQWHSEPVRRE